MFTSCRWLLVSLLTLSCVIAPPAPRPQEPARPPPPPAERESPGAPVPRPRPSPRAYLVEAPPAPEPPPAAKPPPAAPAPEPPPLDVDVEGLLRRLTLEQRVGQLMMVGFAGTEVDASVEALVKGRQVGGVCMFKRNITSAPQIARLNEAVRTLLDQVPPFLAVDQEGGNVVRIQEGTVVLPGNMALGATRSAKLAYEAGRAQAEALKLLGFNMNLAPVLDVNLNPKNPVIGIRSFGDDPALVSELGAELIRGQQDADLVTVAKHFPGHGSTDADSHRALPVMRESATEVERQMAPFSTAIVRGLDGLMTAHVAVPALTGNDEPATLSRDIIGGLLRKKLGFTGLVVTDELEMEAIAQRYGVGRAAVLAIGAGADMVLIPWRPEKKTEVYQALLAAAHSGELRPERIEEAVRRILTVKARRGLFKPPLPLAERLARLQDALPDVDRRIARGSVTLLRASGRELPLAPSRRVGVITAEASLADAVLARAGSARSLVVRAYPSPRERAQARAQARELALASDVVVVGVINSRQLELVTMAAATGKPVIVVVLGLPYLAELVPEAKAVLALYSYREVSTEAAAAALFGEQGTPGRLPVSLRHFPLGHGLDAPGRARGPAVSASEGPAAISHRAP